ncbi:DUF3795 domain-containing protein [candidate division KSB1 bacterium]|nr:DUF3795 domain-containing protein [candidate division KSB1 bacterium]
MNSVLAYCGLLCDGCPIYWMSIEKNAAKKAKMREVIAEMTRELYGMEMSAEDFTECDGCLSISGKLFAACIDCQIRKCAQQKQLKNCAHCNDYPCEHLQKIFSEDPGAKIRLDFIKRCL